MFAKYGNKKKGERKQYLKFVGNQMMFDHAVYAKYRLTSPWLAYIYSSTLGRNKKLLTFGLNW